eukprot:CAMPEP_0172026856 /NCGR_PEP_ID=MMETSP1041-20130122/16684_1 /TAXON_ID=464988 /ORGANISM="Hemiselmis andersenii, Strain CCMP439" /LENGTH=93 /DNA_ID=CAMNT_0012682707 /DNA_START=377 /DNA_END=654 /DNA_ORIENTATION=+
MTQESLGLHQAPSRTASSPDRPGCAPPSPCQAPSQPLAAPFVPRVPRCDAQSLPSAASPQQPRPTLRGGCRLVEGSLFLGVLRRLSVGSAPVP